MATDTRNNRRNRVRLIPGLFFLQVQINQQLVYTLKCIVAFNLSKQLNDLLSVVHNISPSKTINPYVPMRQLYHCPFMRSRKIEHMFGNISQPYIRDTLYSMLRKFIPDSRKEIDSVLSIFSDFSEYFKNPPPLLYIIYII